MGVIIYGHEDSPVVPMLVYLYSKIGYGFLFVVNIQLSVVKINMNPELMSICFFSDVWYEN